MDHNQKTILPASGVLMQCPYSDKHEIMSEHYFHHLNVCNKRLITKPYSFLKPFVEQPLPAVTIQLTIEMARSIFSKLDSFVQANRRIFQFFANKEKVLSVPIKTPFLESQKHAPQLKSITAHLLPFLEQDQLIIEAGAGSGMLSAYIAWLDGFPSLRRRFALIERDQGFKHKFDRYARRSGELVERIVCDLREVDFSLFLDHLACQNSLVIGKHLCGHATDCVLEWKARKYAIALCCHSKADGSLMTGKDYLDDLLSQEEIHVMYKMTSWQFAWLNSKESVTAEQECTRNEKAKLGAEFRQVIDVCRVLWLESHGYSVQIIEYCDKIASPECYLLLAESRSEKSK